MLSVNIPGLGALKLISLTIFSLSVDSMLPANSDAHSPSSPLLTRPFFLPPKPRGNRWLLESGFRISLLLLPGRGDGRGDGVADLLLIACPMMSAMLWWD